MTDKLTCKICGHQERDYLSNHILEAHNLTAQEYLGQYPKAGVLSGRLLKRWEKDRPDVRRNHPPKPEKLTIDFAGITFPVNIGVPKEACLPLPEQYLVPRHGDLGHDVQHVAISLYHHRSIFAHGLPGSGKDATFHAFSALTRTPAIMRQVQPGSDIESWFFSRSFTQEGTYWEEGEVLKALRDGYLTPEGRKIPYLFLVSDFDRADRSQSEYIRLIMDSIQGRVQGGGGQVHEVLPGTIIAATANSAGSGDNRGRCISSNPIDASILDRFQRKLHFHWMDWKDEEVIIKRKFPRLLTRVPQVATQMGKVTDSLRVAIYGEELYAEFSHRALCSILEHAQDMLDCTSKGKIPKNLLKMACRVWLDGLSDEETRQSAKNLMDPHLAGGVVDQGNTDHLKPGNPAGDGWSA